MIVQAVTAVSDFLWGWPLIIILFGTHIFMTIRTGFIAIPNIIAVLLLSNEIAKDTKKYKGKHIDDVDTTEIPVVKNAKRGVLHINMEDINHTDW